MSLRLVKQQLAALSKDQGTPEHSKNQPQGDKTKSKVTKLKNKLKKKLHKKEKAAAEKALSEEDIRKRNLDYYKKTAGISKNAEAMIQVRHCSSSNPCANPYRVKILHEITVRSTSI